MAVDALFLVHLGLKAAALFGGVGFFAKAVGQFHPAGIKFKAFGDARVIRRAAGEGGLGSRIAVKDGRAAVAKVGFDPGDEDFGQHVRPGVIGRMVDLCAKSGGVRAAIGGQRGQQVDVGVTPERLGHRQAFGCGEGIAGAVAESQHGRACGGAGDAQHGGAVIHQGGIVSAAAIPFQHGKLGRVQRPTFAVAPDMGKGGDARLTGRQQLFHGKLGAGVQIHRVVGAVAVGGPGGEGVQMRLIPRADLQGGGVNLNKALIGQPVAQG